MKPIIKYPGGKRRELDEIKKHIPSFNGRYIEPFVGGGALFWELERENSIINDYNKKLISFYETVRDDFEKLDTELNLLKIDYDAEQERVDSLLKVGNTGVKNRNEELFYEIRDMYNKRIPSSYLDATIYYFLNKTAYSGIVRHNSRGEYNVPFGRYKRLNTSPLTKEHSDLLKKTEIRQGDFTEIFKVANGDDFIFLDPPYDSTFSNYGNVDNDNTGFNKEDHIRLAEAFKNTTAKALMVIGETEFIINLYKDYIIGKYPKRYAINIKNRINANNDHLVITNY